MIMAGFIDDQFGLPPVFRLVRAVDRRPAAGEHRHPHRRGLRREHRGDPLGHLHGHLDHGHHERDEPDRRRGRPGRRSELHHRHEPAGRLGPGPEQGRRHPRAWRPWPARPSASCATTSRPRASSWATAAPTSSASCWPPRASWADSKITTALLPVPHRALPLPAPARHGRSSSSAACSKRKNPISSPGKDHLHHRLLARGLSPARTVILLLSVTLVANIVAMAVQGLSALVIVVTTLAILALLALVAWRRRRAFRRTAARQSAVPLWRRNRAAKSRQSSSARVSETKVTLAPS